MFRTENTGLGIEYKTCYLKLQYTINVSRETRRTVDAPLHLYVIPASILDSISPCSSSVSIASSFYRPQVLALLNRTHREG